MVRNGLVVNSEVVTAAVLPEVQEALEAWLETQTNELNRALAPFGLTSTDLAMPRFREVVGA